MAIAHVQHAAANTVGGTNATPAFGSNVTAGSMLVGMAYIRTATDTVAVSDNRGNVWTQVGTYALEDGNGRRVAMWYALNASAGATTVTFDPTGTAGIDVAIGEYSGVATSNVLDQNNGGGGNADPVTSPQITTTQANEVIIAMCGTHDQVNGMNAPFTLRDNSVNFNQNGWGDNIVSSIQTNISATFDLAAAASCGLFIASFSETSIVSFPPGLADLSSRKPNFIYLRKNR